MSMNGGDTSIHSGDRSLNAQLEGLGTEGRRSLVNWVQRLGVYGMIKFRTAISCSGLLVMIAESEYHTLLTYDLR